MNKIIDIHLFLTHQQLAILRGIVAEYILDNTEDADERALAESMKQVWKQLR